MRRSALAGLVLAVAVSSGAAPPGSEIAVTVSKQGFQPARISVRRGETARLLLSAAEGEHCFAIDAFRVEKRVVAGRPTRLEFAPGQTGVFAFYCCLESGDEARVERGELTVTE